MSKATKETTTAAKRPLTTSSGQFRSITLREAVTSPNGPSGLLHRTKEFAASAELTITREGDTYVLTGTDGRAVEIPSAVVLCAVRFSAVL